MVAINDGGPAFPHSAAWSPTGKSVSLPQPGMSLRDWFAGQILTGIVSGSRGLGPEHFDPVASAAYAMADAMLQAREGR